MMIGQMPDVEVAEIYSKLKEKYRIINCNFCHQELGNYEDCNLFIIDDDNQEKEKFIPCCNKKECLDKIGRPKLEFIDAKTNER